ncbi:phage major tail tube protein [Pasteurella skyensis]|uniref:Phage major tail tube protein n=1 Tax=Phocoenobacter skyensis TaxID=97481 RepID=A0AAJ6P0I0_9PAST|nr:phage major tail tube protein [Pasteurella skyensis]MDP8172608.1 phage major tail tube protein [Pasteurella skyensis]MDP8179108.1 phage major tail tube protein [Pasteurella skyensis]MDP8183207.1 phage major tail tube protein [Pasteurella skyensis]MDP8189258.1 phage major tail tube protein [Pasteurella skyensis]
MSVVINQVDNANVYINGNSFLGKAKNVKTPEFEVEFVEHDNLGLIGKLKLPSKVNALEGEIVWDGFYPEVAAIASNPFKNNQLMVRANVRVFNAQGQATEVPLVMTMNVAFSKVNLGEYKKEPTEYPMTYQVHTIKQVIDGKEVLFYNAFSNQYRVAGEDILQKYRANIGG